MAESHPEPCTKLTSRPVCPSPATEAAKPLMSKMFITKNAKFLQNSNLPAESQSYDVTSTEENEVKGGYCAHSAQGHRARGCVHHLSQQ